MSSNFSKLAEQARSGPAFAWAIHCNLAMPIMDSIGCTHEQANRAAARVMADMFSIDVTVYKAWTAFPWAAPSSPDAKVVEP